MGNAIHLNRPPEMPYEMSRWWERSLRSVANVTAPTPRSSSSSPPRSRCTAVEAHPLEDANLALARLASGEVRGAAVLTTPR